ncbi:hypothetical protein H5410_037219 [Solanum commersonii]|uniref:Uncharacterized protein n=1 Tax=Solanum commersonii TaxID=4109 RepID=A0A9J5Y5N4_SOLCO|nr:hypothetical protein H5410_037219 [Solanum commersonii]
MHWLMSSCGFLWKRRNTILHNGSYSTNRVIWDISNTIKNFIKLKFKFKYSNSPNNGPQMVAMLDSFMHVFISMVVRRRSPPLGGRKGVRIQDTTNMVAEAIALKKGHEYCLEIDLSPVILEYDSLSLVNMLMENGLFIGV